MSHVFTVGYEKNKMEKIFELENMVSNLYARGENESLSRPSRTTIIESLCTSAWDYEYGTRLVILDSNTLGSTCTSLVRTSNQLQGIDFPVPNH